jgi:hypothetical protein
MAIYPAPPSGKAQEIQAQRIAHLESALLAKDKRIKDLEDAIDLRDAAITSLCIAIHGEERPGTTIYQLASEAAELRKRVEALDAKPSRACSQRIRIALAISPSGDWEACGSSKGTSKNSMQDAHCWLIEAGGDLPFSSFWIEADVAPELPETKTATAVRAEGK